MGKDGQRWAKMGKDGQRWAKMGKDDLLKPSQKF